LSARQVSPVQLVLVLWFVKGDTVAGEMCARVRCYCNCLDRIVASADVTPVIVTERDLKLELDLVVLAVEAGSEGGFGADPGLEVGSISAVAAVAEG
jgi:hypothetical protein